MINQKHTNTKHMFLWCVIGSFVLLLFVCCFLGRLLFVCFWCLCVCLGWWWKRTRRKRIHTKDKKKTNTATTKHDLSLTHTKKQTKHVFVLCSRFVCLFLFVWLVYWLLICLLFKVVCCVCVWAVWDDGEGTHHKRVHTEETNKNNWSTNNTPEKTKKTCVCYVFSVRLFFLFACVVCCCFFGYLFCSWCSCVLGLFGMMVRAKTPQHSTHE